MSREKLEQFKAGSEAYNRDVADIKWLVSTLKGILEKVREVEALPKDFAFTADLFRDPWNWNRGDSVDTWSIIFTHTDKGIDVFLLEPLQGQGLKTKWEQVRFSTSYSDVPIYIAEKIANNLDPLIQAFIDADATDIGMKDLMDKFMSRGQRKQQGS